MACKSPPPKKDDTKEFFWENERKFEITENRVQQKKRQMWALYSLAKQNQGAAMRSSRSTSSLRSHIELRDTLEALRSEAMVGDTESTASSRASGGHAARKRGQSKLDKLTRETALMRKEQKSQRRV